LTGLLAAMFVTAILTVWRGRDCYGMALLGGLWPGGLRLRGGRHSIFAPGFLLDLRQPAQFPSVVPGSAPGLLIQTMGGVRVTSDQNGIIHASALERVWQTILLCDRIEYTHIEPWPVRPRECRQWACIAAQGSWLMW
jgi:hypothetical protein